MAYRIKLGWFKWQNALGELFSRHYSLNLNEIIQDGLIRPTVYVPEC